MRVDQAIYGTIRNGHGLRCASGDLRLAADLAQRLDLPDTEPLGANWSPVTSGFPSRDKYVLARTFSDPTVGRSGMVISHALICDLAEIVGVNDLRPLLTHLITSAAAAPDAVEPLDVSPGQDMPPASPDLADAAQALVARGNGPVVRIGSAGFEELIVALWGRLWPALRGKLYFRLSFSPKDVVEKPGPTIVCTPASLIGRWQDQRVMGRNVTGGLKAASMIDGSPDGNELHAFGDRIGADLDGFQDLQLLEQAHAMARASPDTVARLVSAARLIERLSPDPARGAAEKEAIVGRLSCALPGATPSEILTLRNLALPGFATSGTLWLALEEWLVDNGHPASHDTEAVTIVTEALVGTDAVAPWRAAARRGLERSSRAPGGAFAAAFWRWAKAAFRTSSPLVALVAADRKALDAVVAAAPTELDPATAKPIIEAAGRFGLPRLHAVAASGSMTPADAARAQSAAENSTDPTAMRLALRRVKRDELLDVFDDVPDDRVLTIAGEAVAEDPKLLARRDMSTVANRRVWAASLKENPAAWDGPAEPRMAFDQLLTEQIDGAHPPTELLDRLSTTPLADVTSFPRRTELWAKLPATIRDRLLAATIDAWFARFGTDAKEAALEAPLTDRILVDARLGQLLDRVTARGIAEGLRVVDALGGLDASRFRTWILTAVRSRRPLNSADAELIGRALATRRRRDIVSDFVAFYRGGRGDLAPALRHCIDLIGFWDRMFLGLSSVSSAEKWDSLVELAAELYPKGPDQEALWSRAGGRDSDLRHHGTGKERWHSALRDIQNGRPPRISKLISEMRIDYPQNTNLSMLADDTLFCG
ncbi:GAP1-N1 domain-containing protein [Sphingobium scionense]|uniref:GAP1-N1 domain-containing protein n=1 Tax=Sphingobium scionense TaxID=1404341 RepID=UPI00165E94E2|nr:effector-associated domain EAD1-containing protein [Sphingobium scionense]